MGAHDIRRHKSKKKKLVVCCSMSDAKCTLWNMSRKLQSHWERSKCNVISNSSNQCCHRRTAHAAGETCTRFQTVFLHSASPSCAVNISNFIYLPIHGRNIMQAKKKQQRPRFTSPMRTVLINRFLQPFAIWLVLFNSCAQQMISFGGLAMMDAVDAPNFMISSNEISIGHTSCIRMLLRVQCAPSKYKRMSTAIHWT